MAVVLAACEVHGLLGKDMHRAHMYMFHTTLLDTYEIIWYTYDASLTVSHLIFYIHKYMWTFPSPIYICAYTHTHTHTHTTHTNTYTFTLPRSHS